MDNSATFGTVIAVVESQGSNTKLQLRLVNTLGKQMVVWVEAPASVAGFFAPETGLPEASAIQAG